jgi:hypothetical protein
MQLNQHNPCDMAYCPLTHPCVSILSNIVSDLSTYMHVCVCVCVCVFIILDPLYYN